MARRFGGFALIDGHPATMEGHEEFGGVRLQTLGGVTIWRRDHPDRPPPAAEKKGFRIVVLGDSVLQPALLDDRDGTARLLEAELNARLDGGPYEVVNLSEGGWDTLQEEQVLLHEGLPLSPDLVLVGVSPNDAEEFAFRDGRLFRVNFLRDLDQRPTTGLSGLLATHSYLYNLLWLRWKEFTYATVVFGEPREMEAVVEPLRRMTARNTEQGARTAILCFPYLREDRFDPASDRCPFQRLVEWASEARVPLLDPIPVYSRYPNRKIRLDHIHLSRLGHRILARATFDWLVGEHLVPYQRVSPASTD